MSHFAVYDISKDAFSNVWQERNRLPTSHNATDTVGRETPNEPLLGGSRNSPGPTFGLCLWRYCLHSILYENAGILGGSRFVECFGVIVFVMDG